MRIPYETEKQTKTKRDVLLSLKMLYRLLRSGLNR